MCGGGKTLLLKRVLQNSKISVCDVGTHGSCVR